MNTKNDHTVLITVCILTGIVLTISVAIIGSVYNNGKNIDRDKYLFSHCNQTSKVDSSGAFVTTTKYECGGK